MPRLAESIRLEMDDGTLHAQLATDDGYVVSRLDLKNRIGNERGKFIVGEERKDDINWRRWVPRGFRGTVLRGKLREDEPQRSFSGGNWVFDEIDLGKHVCWIGKELAFSTAGDDAIESGVLRSLLPTDQLEFQNGKLLARPREEVQSIHLDAKLGNLNGKFDLNGANFSYSARNCKLDGTVLTAELGKVNGTWVDDCIDLRRFVRWRDETLVFSVPDETIPSILPMNCRCCRALFRYGQFYLPLDAKPVMLDLALSDSTCHMCKLFRLLVHEYSRSGEESQEMIVAPAFHKHHRQAEVTIRRQSSNSNNSITGEEVKYFMYNRSDLQTSSKTFQALPRTSYCDDWYEPDQRWSFVHQWLANCSKTHGEQCKREPWAVMPARILDLTDLYSGTVRLLETAGQCERYACLSHCWGPDEIAAKLTRQNIESYRTDGINVVTLPKTFQDAMEICRKLEIRYLWIDSLCIRQDSKLDWQEESPKMAAYYGNCFCCIAAASSPGSRSGCQLRERPTATKITGRGPDGIPYRVLAYPVQDIEKFDHTRHFTQISEESLGKDFPLLRRAWGFQERRLAPRILHLCDHEVVLECASDLLCECGHVKDDQVNWTKAIIQPDLQKYKFGFPTPHPKSYVDQGPDNDWRMACTIYSTLLLTFPDDKLTAISGLAKSQDFSGQYLAGIWESNLLANMCWYVGPDLVPADPSVSRQNWIREKERRLAQKFRPAGYVAPSWSWASVDEPITYRLISKYPRPRPYTSLQRAEMKFESHDPMGRITPGSHLILRGRTIESKWSCNVGSEAEERSYKLNDLLGSQGNFTLYGSEGEYVCIWFHGKDPWTWSPEPLSFLPDYDFTCSGMSSVSADEPLHMMPLLSEKTLIGIDRLNGNLNGQTPIRGFDGNGFVYSEYPKVCALVLRRLHDHHLGNATSSPVFERVGFTACVVHESVANAWFAVEEQELVLV